MRCNLSHRDLAAIPTLLMKSLVLLAGPIALAASVYAASFPAASRGLDRPPSQIVVGPRGVFHPPYNPGSARTQLTVDLRQTILWANENSVYADDRPLPKLPAELPPRSKDNAELYPLNAVPVADGFWFVGGTVIGRQHRDLPWAFNKTLFDGDALRFEAAAGATVTVHGLRAVNVEDGISPRLASGVSHDGVVWKAEQCYFRYIRDDVIENDALLDGEITDCLVDGTFVFLSQRPGARSTTTRPHAMTRVRGCLVHLERMPYEKDIGLDAPAAGSIVDGKGLGMPFKFKGPASGRLEVRDTIFLIDGLSVNGARAMSFPTWDGCRYENVTIVWRGGGAYPGQLPARGVKVTDDLEVWTQARTAWLAAHPGATDGL
jgi:hypothetical protein